MYIIAIDPGVTSGIAIRDLATNMITTCVCKTPEAVFDLLLGGTIKQIVIENFQAQQISKYGLHTVRVVGGTYSLAYEHKIPYEIHMPQDRYAFLSDSKEFLDGVKKDTGYRYMEHEKDALAHLLRWEYNQEQLRKKDNIG